MKLLSWCLIGWSCQHLGSNMINFVCFVQSTNQNCCNLRAFLGKIWLEGFVLAASCFFHVFKFIPCSKLICMMLLLPFLQLSLLSSPRPVPALSGKTLCWSSGQLIEKWIKLGI